LKDYKGKGKVFEWTDHPGFLEKVIKDLKQPRWNWHCLRHRRASIWANDKMPLIEIMQRLGHSNLGTTQRYLQLLGFTYG
jgi:integrase